LAAIIAVNGEPLTKRITSPVLRRTVATQLAETLGDEGDKLVKRLMGHSDGGVRKIYNRYGYVREMRKWLAKWANELTDPAAIQRTLSASRTATNVKLLQDNGPTRQSTIGMTGSERRARAIDKSRAPSRPAPTWLASSIAVEMSLPQADGATRGSAATRAQRTLAPAIKPASLAFSAG